MMHLLLKQMKDSMTDLGIVTFVQYKNANSNIFYDLKKNYFQPQRPCDTKIFVRQEHYSQAADLLCQKVSAIF